METLKEILEGYFQSKSEVAAAYLFGSHAREKAQPSSDIDIAVLLHNRGDGLHSEIRDDLLLELSRLTRKEVDVVILNGANLTLLQQVFSKGICLVVNDKEQLAVFMMVAFSEIADFAYYRSAMERRFVREVLEE
jgi:uncharacterized protein